jgi:hypothetical protein
MVMALGGVESALANQAMSVGGSKAFESSMILDEGVIPAFGKPSEIQNIIDGNMVQFDPISPVRNPRRGRRKPIERVTPTDGVLNSVQSVRDQYMKIQNRIEALAKSGKDFSSTDLMRMQYDVMQLTYINELSSKTADKTSQGAQTLFRNQG